jgi:hypothetical protein
MGIHLVCWRCGATLRKIPLPLTRLAQCPACSSDLHVCRLCRFYDLKVAGYCTHDTADPARDVDVANFCQHFRATPDAYTPSDKSKHTQAAAQFQALFASAAPATDTFPAADLTDAKSKFDALFKNK